MGSPIRSYLWLCCGVFHQLPTLARALTSSGERYKGSEGLMLCLHLSCLFLLSASLPVYLLCVVADRRGNVCLFMCACRALNCAHFGLHLSFCFNVSFSSCTRLTHEFHTVPSEWSVFTYTCRLHTCTSTCDSGDHVAKASRGGLLTVSHGRGASSTPALRKQTS